MMFKIVVVLVGLVGVLGQASDAGRVSQLLGLDSSNKADFDGLNKWLGQRQVDAEDVEKNVAEVKNNLGKLSSKVKRAAELFVAYVEADECDDHLLETVTRIDSARVNLKANKRVEQLMSSKTDHIARLCGQYVDEAVERVYQQWLADRLSSFLQAVVFKQNWRVPRIGSTDKVDWKVNSLFDDYMSNENEGLSDEPGLSGWAAALGELAEGDPKAVVNEIKSEASGAGAKQHRNLNNFNYIYDKYLVEPCKTLDGDLSGLLHGLYAMSRLRDDVDDASQGQLIFDRTNTVLHMLYGFKACRSLNRLDSISTMQIADQLPSYQVDPNSGKPTKVSGAEMEKLRHIAN